MAKTTKLTVKTDVGTYERSTARTYTHIVVARGVRHELLEASRLRNIADATEQIAHYREVLADIDGTVARELADRRRRQGDSTSAFALAWCNEAAVRELVNVENYTEYLVTQEARLAQLVAQGVITDDTTENWGVLGWCGRLDLAEKLLRTQGTDRFDSPARYRHVRVYALDGTEVRQLRYGK